MCAGWHSQRGAHEALPFRVARTPSRYCIHTNLTYTFFPRKWVRKLPVHYNWIQNCSRGIDNSLMSEPSDAASSPSQNGDRACFRKGFILCSMVNLFQRYYHFCEISRDLAKNVLAYVAASICASCAICTDSQERSWPHTSTCSMQRISKSDHYNKYCICVLLLREGR